MEDLQEDISINDAVELLERAERIWEEYVTNDPSLLFPADKPIKQKKMRTTKKPSTSLDSAYHSSMDDVTPTFKGIF